MGKQRLKVETVLAVTSALLEGGSPKEISTRFGISDSSVSRIRQKYAPQLKYHRFNGKSPEPQSKQLQLNLISPVVKAPVAPADETKKYRTVKYGNDEFVIPEKKNVRFTINDADNSMRFEIL